MLHLLTPSVEHSEEPDLCSKMLGGSCYFEQRFCSRLEENPVDYTFILQSERGKLLRHGEDHVKVRHRQQLAATISQPPFPGCSLTLRAMAIPAGVVGNNAVTAPVTRVHMTAENGCPAVLNRMHHAKVPVVQQLGMLIEKVFSVDAYDVGNLAGRSFIHRKIVAPESASSGLEVC